jgi:hypothetical protein
MFKNNLTNISNPNIPNKKLNFTEITKSILYINFNLFFLNLKRITFYGAEKYRPIVNTHK